MISATDAARRSAKAARILIAGCASEPTAVLNAVAADPAIWQGRTLTGAFIPGVNDRDFSAIGQGTRVETIFATAGLQTGRSAGQVAHLPLHYSTFWSRLARPGVVDLVLTTVPPPARDGTVGYGLACDFAPAAIAAGARLIGVVNPLMPDPPGSPRLPLSRFEALVDGAALLPELSTGLVDAANRQIAAAIVERIPQGGTLQLGLGKLQTAVLAELAGSGRTDLGYHAGMISDGILDVIDAGVFGRGITTGVALGSRAFYDLVGHEVRINWRPVGTTHLHSTLAALTGFVSVTSVLQVDLTGQANAEYFRGRQVSGQGGVMDFVRGARAAQGGLAILALPSTGGAESRIVARLSEGTPVSVPRADVDLVITEHGVADLREASLPERAERLIAIAAPEFRTALSRGSQS